MDITDNKRMELTKVTIDFGTIDDAEYDVLCATAFSYQGRSWPNNYTYEEVSNNGNRLFKRERTGSVFEFPSNEWCDAWLNELPKYIKTKRRKTRQRALQAIS